MGIRGQLREVERELINDLFKSNISSSRLAKKYGVSRQAIFNFCHRKGIKRSRRGHADNCPICQNLIKISKEPHGDFISSQTLKEKLRIDAKQWNYHITVLREKGLIPPKFGRLQSKRVELAYHLYFTKKLTLKAIGRQVGLKNVPSLIRNHKVSGWNVPPSYRRHVRSEMNKEERKSGKGK